MHISRKRDSPSWNGSAKSSVASDQGGTAEVLLYVLLKLLQER